MHLAERSPASLIYPMPKQYIRFIFFQEYPQTQAICKPDCDDQFHTHIPYEDVRQCARLFGSNQMDWLPRLSDENSSPNSSSEYHFPPIPNRACVSPIQSSLSACPEDKELQCSQAYQWWQYPSLASQTVSKETQLPTSHCSCIPEAFQPAGGLITPLPLSSFDRFHSDRYFEELQRSNLRYPFPSHDYEVDRQHGRNLFPDWMQTSVGNAIAPQATSRPSSPVLKELEVFAEHFKQRRMKLGITQSDVGRALGALNIPGLGSLSQSTICRFESLTLSHSNMQTLQPHLQIWLDRTEARLGSTCPKEMVPPLAAAAAVCGGRGKRKRTCITDTERWSLEAYFQVQPQPSSERIGQIAEMLGLKRSVVRVWFCNQRQKQKRLKCNTGLRSVLHIGL